MIRRYLLAVVPVLVLMFAGVDLPVLQGLLLTNLVSFIVCTALALLVAWKVWDEYWRK
jgi:multisubunit Na+/H+ antiporter MnhC subunit